MAEFFQTNHDIVYFIYGEAFFILGLAIALQSRKHSQLRLARHLHWLAIFGIVHGIYEWGAVFIPIQQTYLDPNIVDGLRIGKLALEVISFLALFQFGVAVLTSIASPRALRFAPIVMLTAWAVSVFVLQWWFGDSFTEFLNIGDTMARYLLGAVGATAAAWGLWQQAHQVNQMDLSRIARYFRGAAFVFAAYALSSAIVPRGDFFPASVLNYDSFLNVLGVPAAIFRAVCGMLTAYLIIRGLEIFDIETDRLIEDAAEAHAVATDRERIGRELHDSIIQSLYAAGLMLEDATLTIDEDAARTKNRIGEVVNALNRTMRDIRSYILDLRRDGTSANWQTDLGEMVRAFRLQTLIDTQFSVDGISNGKLSDNAGKEILTIAREALTNAARHARATHISVNLFYRPEQIELTIADNGIGFERDDEVKTSTPGEHQGLANMCERAQLIGARLTIESALQRGTTIQLVLPSNGH